MKVLFYSSRSYDRESFQPLLEKHGIEATFLESRLSPASAAIAREYDAACLFVNDHATREVLESMVEGGTLKGLALRSAGFNHVDLKAAKELGIRIARVPAYSPEGVAEHAVALLLTLNRRVHRAYNRIREGNFSLEGLVGFNLYGKTAGVIGTGKIGAQFCRILLGFGCRVLAHDPYPNQELTEAGVSYQDLDPLLKDSDILSLHCPLTPETHHLLNNRNLGLTKQGVYIINTSRGALIDTRALIEFLKNGHLGGLALDVYEEEEALFFKDLSGTIIQDDLFMRLITFPQVVVTGHQAFLTHEALGNIAETSVHNLLCFRDQSPCPNEL